MSATAKRPATRTGKITSSPLSIESDDELFESDYFSDKMDPLFDESAPDDSIEGHIVSASKTGDNLTFHFGITDGATDHDAVLGMIVLSTLDPVYLTISETGGQTNESFLYHITDTETGEEVLTVTVQGGGSVTIVLPRGTYTVTESSDWSWKYGGGTVTETKVKYPDDRTDDLWVITRATDPAVADTARIPFGDSADRASVTFRHQTSGKNWLGGEAYKPNVFK